MIIKLIRISLPIFNLILLFNFSAFAQKETLTNESIIELQKSGFSKTFIINKINSSICDFDLSIPNLKELKKAKLSEDIINAMSKKESDNETAKTEPERTKTPDKNKIIAPKSGYKPPLNQSTGIYYLNNLTHELIEVDLTVYSQSKDGTGILNAFNSFAKTKAKATLRGTKANLQITDSFPVFYFYFDKSLKDNLGDNINTSGYFANATTPNEFTLVKLEIPKNGKTREIVTSSTSVIKGNTEGVDEEQNFRFKYEKVFTGVYKVYFPSGIKKGEYGFMYAGASTATANKVYDFGIE